MHGSGDHRAEHHLHGSHYQPKPLGLSPLVLAGVGAEGAEKILGYWGWISSIFFIKCTILKLKCQKKFAPAARFSWNIHFWCLSRVKLSQIGQNWPQKTMSFYRFIPPLVTRPPLVRGGINHRVPEKPQNFLAPAARVWRFKPHFWTFQRFSDFKIFHLKIFQLPRNKGGG